MITASCVDEAFYGLADMVMTNGALTAPRGGRNTRELLSITVGIQDVRDRRISCPIRQPREDYCGASMAWNLQGKSDAESICWWNPNGWNFADRYGKNEEFHGANYGERINWQIAKAIELLKRDGDSRRAWVSVWNQDTELNGGYFLDGKDVPCTVGFGLRVLNGQLYMQTVMRSQSVIGVFPYDAFLFTTLFELIANELGVGLGLYIHTCNSAHIYENEWQFAKDIVSWYEEHGSKTEPMLPLRYTIAEATDRWGRTEEVLRTSSQLELINPDLFDQVEEMMFKGALERAKATA